MAARSRRDVEHLALFGKSYALIEQLGETFPPIRSDVKIMEIGQLFSIHRRVSHYILSSRLRAIFITTGAARRKLQEQRGEARLFRASPRVLDGDLLRPAATSATARVGFVGIGRLRLLFERFAQILRRLQRLLFTLIGVWRFGGELFEDLDRLVDLRRI